jgi:hypothetical protein
MPVQNQKSHSYIARTSTTLPQTDITVSFSVSATRHSHISRRMTFTRSRNYSRPIESKSHFLGLDGLESTRKLVVHYRSRVSKMGTRTRRTMMLLLTELRLRSLLPRKLPFRCSLYISFRHCLGALVKYSGSNCLSRNKRQQEPKGARTSGISM